MDSEILLIFPPGCIVMILGSGDRKASVQIDPKLDVKTLPVNFPEGE